MGDCLHLKYLKTLLWLPQYKFNIWIRSDQWLLFKKIVFKCMALKLDQAMCVHRKTEILQLAYICCFPADLIERKRHNCCQSYS